MKPAKRFDWPGIISFQWRDQLSPKTDLSAEKVGVFKGSGQKFVQLSRNMNYT